MSSCLSWNVSRLPDRVKYLAWMLSESGFRNSLPWCPWIVLNRFHGLQSKEKNWLFFERFQNRNCLFFQCGEVPRKKDTKFSETCIHSPSFLQNHFGFFDLRRFWCRMCLGRQSRLRRVDKFPRRLRFRMQVSIFFRNSPLFWRELLKKTFPERKSDLEVPLNLQFRNFLQFRFERKKWKRRMLLH